jgi:hypothetical protein
MIENTKKDKSLRICNFELAAEMPSKEDHLELTVEACSIIYASPLILNYFTSSASPSSSLVIGGASKGAKSKKKIYNPFQEDVFSLGLTIMQIALFCNCQQIKDLRADEETLKRSIYMDCKYSDNIKCLLLMMLKWSTEERPDFIQLEQIIKDLFRLD